MHLHCLETCVWVDKTNMNGIGLTDYARTAASTLRPGTVKIRVAPVMTSVKRCMQCGVNGTPGFRSSCRTLSAKAFHVLEMWHGCGTSPCWIGKASINGPCSRATKKIPEGNRCSPCNVHCCRHQKNIPMTTPMSLNTKLAATQAKKFGSCMMSPKTKQFCTRKLRSK